jgi:23S rRNA pseudouridine2605 synthase
MLASAGFGSRRACEELIVQSRVSVNGKVAKLGDSADPNSDVVRLDGEKLVREKLVYWIVNKPEGVITSVRDPEGRATILGLLPNTGSRVFPVGRLDLGTSGLVLLTNDGGLTQRMLHPSLGNEREYRVTAKGCISEKTFGRLRSGVHIEDGKTGRSEVTRIRVDPKSETTTFSLMLTEGRKRQIRRSMMALGHPVKRLVRIRMGPLRLGRLATGQARPLRNDEIRALRDHVAALRPTPRKRGSTGRRHSTGRRRPTSR